MPTEPPRSAWAFPDLGSAGNGDLVGLGADLAPGTLLQAYRCGMFPMPIDARGIGRRSLDPRKHPPQRQLAWWSPTRRGVLGLDELVVSRSLRRSVRDFNVRVNTAFSDVVAHCADPARPGSWIDDEVITAYTRLHELGWAHSVETWSRDGELVGGLYGVAIGGLFAGESMFHHRRDASKVALVHLVDLLRADTRPERLIDVQWRTDHLATLGVVEVDREEYLRRLTPALELPLPTAFA